MLVILRLRSFLISLDWSLIAGFGGEDSATKSEALHVPRQTLSKTTSINETPNKQVVFQNHTIVYGTTSTEQTGQENPCIRPCLRYFHFASTSPPPPPPSTPGNKLMTASLKCL